MPKRSSVHITENLKKFITSTYSILSAMLSRIGGYIKKLKKFITSSYSILSAMLSRISFSIWNWLRKRNWSAGAMLLLTLFLLILSFYDIPNYPLRGYRAIPTETYSYIDTSFGNHIIYETEYTVKHSKLFEPRFHNFSIYLPPKSTSGFIGDSDDEERRGFGIKSVDAPTGMVRIENIYEINPILLSIKYTSGKKIIPEYLVHQEALSDIQNDSIMLDSFYLKVENVCDHDIKTLRLNSNVTRWIDRNLPELKNTSWTDQRVMIYDRGLPVDDSRIDERGIIIWDVSSIEPHEQKIYYFKKVKST